MLELVFNKEKLISFHIKKKEKTQKHVFTELTRLPWNIQKNVLTVCDFWSYRRYLSELLGS